MFVALPTAGPDAGKLELTYDAYGSAGPTTDLLIDVVGYTQEQVANKSFSLPITGGYIQHASISASFPGGLRFPDGNFGSYPSIDHSFVLPDDYTTGTPIAVDISWVVGQPCTPALLVNNLTVTREGRTQIKAPSTSAGLTLEALPVATPNIVNTTTLTITSPDPSVPLEAGDNILFGIFRRGDAITPAPDTCEGFVITITGMNVRYQ